MSSIQRRSRYLGVSLIELVVVLIVVGALASMAVPRLNNSDSVLAAQAHRLARDLRHIQAMAMNQGRRLTLNVQSISTYRVTFSGSTVIDPATQQPYAVTLDNNVTLSGLDTEFDSMGRPVAGSNLLTTERIFTLTSHSRTAVVTLTPVSGFVGVAP